MSDDLHKIDDLFRKALEDNVEHASDGAWENIDKALDKKKVIVISKQYRALKWVAAALLLFSAGMAMYAIKVHEKNKELVEKTIEGDASHPGEHAKAHQIPGILNESVDKEKKNNDTAAKSNEPVLNITSPSMAPQSKSVKAFTIEKGKNQNLPFDLNSSPGLLNKSYNSAGVLDSSEVITENLSLNKNIVENSETANQKLQKDSVDQFTERGNQKILPKATSEVLTPKYLSMVPITSKHVKLEDFTIDQRQPPTNNFTNDKFTDVKKVTHSKNHSKVLNTLNNSGAGKFYATVYYSPDIVSTRVKDDRPRFREDDRHEIEKSENIESSHTTGFAIGYSISKKWLIETGLNFSRRVTAIEPKAIFARPDDHGNVNYRINCSAGYSFIKVKTAGQPLSGDSLNAFASSNTLQYTGIPLEVKYSAGTGKFIILAGAGLTANFLNKAKIEATIASPTGNQKVETNNISGLKSVYVNGIASLEGQYYFNKYLALTFMPAAKFGLSPINKNAPVKTNFNSLALAAGVVVKF